MLRERRLRFRPVNIPELDTNFSLTEVFAFFIIGFIFATRGKRVKAQKFNLKDRTRTLNDYFLDQYPQTFPQILSDAARYSLELPGKRIRPLMTMASYEIFRPLEEEVLSLAAGTEMIHVSTIIQDDLPCMDDDSLRRGQASNHIKFGEHISILTASILITDAISKILLECRDKSRAVRIIKLLCSCYRGVICGQIVDIASESSDKHRTEEEKRFAETIAKLDGFEALKYIQIHKTAKLMELAIVGGALMAGCSEQDVDILTEVSHNVGLAFQVQDDILDCTRTSEELGKTAKKDENMDKLTFPKLLGVEGSRDYAKQLIEDALRLLEPYGSRAENLRELIRKALNRNK